MTIFNLHEFCEFNTSQRYVVEVIAVLGPEASDQNSILTAVIS